MSAMSLVIFLGLIAREMGCSPKLIWSISVVAKLMLTLFVNEPLCPNAFAIGVNFIKN